MDKIFAPWRMDWVSRDSKDSGFEGCPFCGMAETPEDREHRIVARSEGAFVVLNNSPYNPGHLLVIPEVHVGDVTDISPQILFSLAYLQQQSIAALDSALSPNGYNVGMNLHEAGGASITEHVHVHVVPRWNSDTTFMPTTANATIIVEALDETYDRLHGAFKELPDANTGGPNDAIQLDSPKFDGDQ